MKLRLRKIDFKHFKSLEDATLFVRPDVTAIVGENETGKTNLLHAIKKFNQGESFDPLIDRKQHSNVDPVLNFEFEILGDPAELFSILGTEAGAKNSKSLTMEKNGNAYSVLKPKVVPIKSTLANAEVQKIVEKEQVRLKKEAQKAAAEGVTVETPPVTQEIVEAAWGNLDTAPLEHEITKWVLSRLPKIEYFIGYGTTPVIPGEVPIETLVQNPKKFPSVLNLLSLGGLTLENLPKDAAKEFHKYQRASTEITQKINKAWEQEEISIQVSVVPDPPRLVIKVKDGKMDGDVWLSPEQRSHGFQWYLAFFAHFLAELENEVHDSVLLLDDPGVFLHADGQASLLELFQRISNNGNQIIYTTHSPFMLDRDYVERVRYLEKTKDGTRIDNNAWSRGGQGLLPHPIRATLGMLLADSLLYGKSNIVVEGPSEKIYIREFSDFLYLIKSKDTLDFSKITVIPGYAASGIPSQIGFLLNEKINCIAITDSDSEGERIVEKLKGIQEFDKNKIVEIKSIRPSSKRSTIEDLIPKDVFIGALNEVYSALHDDFKPLGDPSPYYPIVPIVVEELKKQGITHDLEKVKIAEAVCKQFNAERILNPDKTIKEEFEPLVTLFARINEALRFDSSKS